MKSKCLVSLLLYLCLPVYRKDFIMAQEKMEQEQPLNLEQFFMTRNEIASRHNTKLELQAMARVRAHLLEDMEEKAKAKATNTKTVAKDSKEK